MEGANTMTVDRCPICNGGNACNVEDAKNCWCMKVEIPQQARDIVPETLKDVSCICQKCAEKYRIEG